MESFCLFAELVKDCPWLRHTMFDVIDWCRYTCDLNLLRSCMKLVGAVICNIYVLKPELSACSPYKKTQEGKKEERNKGRDRQTAERERERKE